MIDFPWAARPGRLMLALKALQMRIAAPSLDAIFAHARQNLAPYQRIRRIVFMELPKTISGKIRRVELRNRENQAEPLLGEFRES